MGRANGAFFTAEDFFSFFRQIGEFGNLAGN